MTTLDQASPRVIYDVHAESWAYVVADHGRYERLMSWVREQGLDPHNIYRLEVYSAQPSARVFEWAYNEQGARYCSLDHDHAARIEACVLATREPYDVILSSLPPGE